MEQKQKVLQAIEGEVQKQRVQLERQRDQFLLTSLEATLRRALWWPQRWGMSCVLLFA